ncbi:MAG: hypothetical protein EOM80_12635 [Erysipelotrichia bacterium]|nr:hypothetical protein [Erysipelotrichia bacterium]
MREKYFFVCVFSLVAAFACAADVNWDELEEKARRYTGEIGETSSERSPDASQRGIDLVLPSQPAGRSMDTTEKTLSEADKRHIAVHMKLANRHFMKKNYQKAIEEAELVFDREPDNQSGRFMRAVIAARLKEHLVAWHNITIARDKDPQNPKIATFIERLKTVSPEPVETPWVRGVFRQIPVSASEKTCDVIESLLLDPSSQNIVELNCMNISAEAGRVWVTLNLIFSAAPDENAIVELLKKASSAEVELVSPASSSAEKKTLDIKFAINGMSVENASARPISDIREFVKSLSEEIDVAISDTEEREPENKLLETVYEISVRDFKTLNDFLRKVSPYARTFKVQSLRLAYIAGSQNLIWKSKVQVFYQLP